MAFKFKFPKFIERLKKQVNMENYITKSKSLNPKPFSRDSLEFIVYG